MSHSPGRPDFYVRGFPVRAPTKTGIAYTRFTEHQARPCTREEQIRAASRAWECLDGDVDAVREVVQMLSGRPRPSTLDPEARDRLQAGQETQG